MDFSFGKEYKLCSKQEIDTLFTSGQNVQAFPFRVKFLVTACTEDVSFKTLISVPKKKMRKAHKRNRIKRLIRESIRQNKAGLESLLQEKKIHLHFAVIFTGDQEPDFDLVQKKYRKIVEQLIQKLHDRELAQ